MLRGPVKAQFGFYIFRVDEVKPASQPTLEDVTDRITQQLRSTNEQKVLNDFIKDFREKYKKQTECADDFRIAECNNAPEEEETNTGPASGGVPGTPQAPQGAPPPQGAPVPPQGAPVPPQGAPVPPQGAPVPPPAPQGAPPPQPTPVPPPASP